jgi:hypothetical protein
MLINKRKSMASDSIDFAQNQWSLTPLITYSLLMVTLTIRHAVGVRRQRIKSRSPIMKPRTMDRYRKSINRETGMRRLIFAVLIAACVAASFSDAQNQWSLTSLIRF